jgi:hypothetical protein
MPPLLEAWRSPVTANKLRVDVVDKVKLPQLGRHVWSQLTTLGKSAWYANSSQAWQEPALTGVKPSIRGDLAIDQAV